MSPEPFSTSAASPAGTATVEANSQGPVSCRHCEVTLTPDADDCQLTCERTSA